MFPRMSQDYNRTSNAVRYAIVFATIFGVGAILFVFNLLHERNALRERVRRYDQLPDPEALDVRNARDLAFERGRFAKLESAYRALEAELKECQSIQWIPVTPRKK